MQPRVNALSFRRMAEQGIASVHGGDVSQITCFLQALSVFLRGGGLAEKQPGVGVNLSGILFSRRFHPAEQFCYR
jgi:hypothetical protein